MEKVRIKVGAPVWQDHRWFNWPRTPAESSIVFEAERSGCAWKCSADGYGGGIHGRPGKYGNGAVYVAVDQVEILDPSTPVFQMPPAGVVLHGPV